MITYAGSFFGYALLLPLVDNIGRRKSIIILWGITTLGVVIISCSWNIYIATIGVFLSGAGCSCCSRVSMTIMVSVIDYYLRQKYSIALQIGFGFGGVSIGIYYWLIRERTIQIVFCAVPAVILFITTYYYIQETPKFLLRKPKAQILKSLNRIGKINLGQSNLITEQDIDQVIQQQDQKQQITTKAMTPYDLIRYKSLRLTTILFNLLFFFITFVYYGPIDLMFLSQILLSSSQLVAYPIAFIFVQRTGRRRIGQLMFGLSAISTGILIFVKAPRQCNFCTQGIIQIVFCFVSRFCVSYCFSIFFIYITEVYPLRVRGIGFGIASASGAIASSLSQLILNIFERKGISPMILFTLFAVLSIICLQFTQQTHNKPLQDQIKEIQAIKDKHKRRDHAYEIHQQQSPKSEQIEMENIQNKENNNNKNKNKFQYDKKFQIE